jgi:hypothetical protein
VYVWKAEYSRRGSGGMIGLPGMPHLLMPGKAN